jgi:PAS domain S-box-containing protein
MSMAKKTDLRLDEDFARLLTGSYLRLVGRRLATGEGATWLYMRASFCLLAHDGAEDPRFIYANKAAQACFGYEWDEFIGLPSRLSAEAPELAERERLLEAVRREGFIEDYRGVRVTKSGQRFLVEQAVVWELIDEAGKRHGQAALFRPPAAQTP